MDKMYSDYQRFPKSYGVLGAVVGAILIGGGSWGLFSAASVDILDRSVPETGIAFLTVIGMTAIGCYIGALCMYADWARSKLWDMCQMHRGAFRRGEEYYRELRELEAVIRYVPQSTMEWARARREEDRASAEVAEESARTFLAEDADRAWRLMRAD